MATTILIADDDAGYRFPLVNLFKDYDYEVLEAETKDEVLCLAKRADFWIVDARLPTSAMEGIQAVQKLVEEDVRPKFPIIFMSVTPESFVRDMLKVIVEKGIHYEWIEKPFELELLIERITRPDDGRHRDGV
jgi:DNA-binding response OmpR family regulator